MTIEPIRHDDKLLFRKRYEDLNAWLNRQKFPANLSQEDQVRLSGILKSTIPSVMKINNQETFNATIEAVKRTIARHAEAVGERLSEKGLKLLCPVPIRNNF